MRKFRLCSAASAVLGVALAISTMPAADARGSKSGGFHPAAHVSRQSSAPKHTFSAPRRTFTSHVNTPKHFNNPGVASHSHNGGSAGGHTLPPNRLVGPAGHSPSVAHSGFGRVGHLRPPHQIGSYRPARWVGGALIVGAGAYYYNSFGVALLPGPDGIPFDLEDYVRSLPDDGMLPPDDPGYTMIDPAQDGRRWTAASIAPDFHYKSASKYDTREDARADALAGCRATSLMPDKCATVSSQQWVAAVSAKPIPTARNRPKGLL